MQWFHGPWRVLVHCNPFFPFCGVWSLSRHLHCRLSIRRISNTKNGPNVILTIHRRSSHHPFLIRFTRRIRRFLSIFAIRIANQFINRSRLQINRCNTNGNSALLLTTKRLLQRVLFTIRSHRPFRYFLCLFLSLNDQCARMRREGFCVLMCVRLISRVRALRSRPSGPFTRFHPLNFHVSKCFSPIRMVFSTNQIIRRSWSVRRH